MAWESIKWVCSNFLCRKKYPDFSDGIQTLRNAYKEMEFRVSLEVHFLLLILHFFPKKLSEVSDEQGEHFHQDIMTTEHSCKGFWNESKLADTVPGCCRQSAPRKEKVNIILIFAFSTTNDLFCTHILCPWRAPVGLIPTIFWITELKLSCKYYMCQANPKKKKFISSMKNYSRILCFYFRAVK